MPLIPRIETWRASYSVLENRGLVVAWPAGAAGRLVLEANLGNAGVEFPAHPGRARTLFRSDAADVPAATTPPGPWQVRWLRIAEDDS